MDSAAAQMAPGFTLSGLRVCADLGEASSILRAHARRHAANAKEWR